MGKENKLFGLSEKVALVASGISIAITGAINSIELNNNSANDNQIECAGDTTWETSLASSREFRVAIWPQRVIITENWRTGVKRTSFEARPNFDRSVWDNLDMAVCQTEAGGWVLFTRNGPPIVLEDLVHPNQLVILNEEKAYYWLPVGPEGEGSIWYYEQNNLKDINLVTGAVTVRDRG